MKAGWWLRGNSSICREALVVHCGRWGPSSLPFALVSAWWVFSLTAAAGRQTSIGAGGAKTTERILRSAKDGAGAGNRIRFVLL